MENQYFYRQRVSAMDTARMKNILQFHYSFNFFFIRALDIK